MFSPLSSPRDYFPESVIQACSNGSCDHGDCGWQRIYTPNMGYVVSHMNSWGNELS